MARRRFGDLLAIAAALMAVALLYAIDSGADEGRSAPSIVSVEDRPSP
jgi:hypothetical protein